MTKRVWKRSAAALALGLMLSAVAFASAGGAKTVVIGSAEYATPYGEGWGSSRPRILYNGGDRSGRILEIRWASWGASTARGYGLNYVFKPRGGYYEQPVIIELRAQKLGRCSPGGPPAYTQLYVRSPERPEGKIRPWSSWSGSSSLCKFGF